jgi:hypothetical protein
MAQEQPDRKVNTDVKIEKEDAYKRLPHERDESPNGDDPEPRGVMKQAASDLAQGMVDTDLHSKPGAVAAVDTASDDGGMDNGTSSGAGTSGQAKPLSDAADGMRLNEDKNNDNSKDSTQ